MITGLPLAAETDLNIGYARQAIHDVQSCDTGSRLIGMPQPHPKRSGHAINDEKGIALYQRHWIDRPADAQCVKEFR